MGFPRPLCSGGGAGSGQPLQSRGVGFFAASAAGSRRGATHEVFVQSSCLLGCVARDDLSHMPNAHRQQHSGMSQQRNF